jgi:hypothetical protein
MASIKQAIARAAQLTKLRDQHNTSYDEATEALEDF